MNNSEKRLLLKDLCGRLPYGVVCSFYDDSSKCSVNGKLIRISITRFDGWNFDTIGVTGEASDKTKLVWSLDGVKPYLRSMSSMTEEERAKYRTECKKALLIRYRVNNHYPVTDWLNEYCFDYRGLIPMGLAIEAPEDMYQF